MPIIIARFGGTCDTCGASIAPGQSINWTRTAPGARATTTHAVAADCQPPAPVAVTTPTRAKVHGVGAIVAFLAAARERGLKYPKARFLDDDHQELRLQLASERSREPGTVLVIIGSEWVGRIRLNGEVTGDAREYFATLQAIAADPVEAAKRYGRLTGNCAFCERPLSDEGSTDVGYGPICARRYGLPHHAIGTPTMTPVPTEEV